MFFKIRGRGKGGLEGGGGGGGCVGVGGGFFVLGVEGWEGGLVGGGGRVHRYTPLDVLSRWREGAQKERSAEKGNLGIDRKLHRVGKRS